MHNTSNQKYKKLFKTICESTTNTSKESFNVHD
jgi:hypothetical protein